MDNMTDESDPSMAIGVAGLHLEEARPASQSTSTNT